MCVRSPMAAIGRIALYQECYGSLRMLENAKLARAMGSGDEEQSYKFHGSNGEVTKQIGNTVPVNLAAALVKAKTGQRS